MARGFCSNVHGVAQPHRESQPRLLTVQFFLILFFWGGGGNTTLLLLANKVTVIWWSAIGVSETFSSRSVYLQIQTEAGVPGIANFLWLIFDSS